MDYGRNYKLLFLPRHNLTGKIQQQVTQLAPMLLFASL